ncbi:MAG: FtsH protease activity modulator HflK [Acetobacteraceae bacterium]|nr:FtsH protease activity modulator HflK [Acetobacteraceae bacterium]
MSWNNGGNTGGPWGNPGGSGNPPPGGKRPERGPWGGGGGGPGRGPNGGPGLPDFDEIIQRLQHGARRFVPGGGGGGPGRGRPGNGRLLGLLALVAAALWLASGIYRVQPDEQGVVQRFGAFEGYTYPGLRYHLPWPIETVVTPSVTRVNRIEVGVRTPPDRLDRAPTGREVPAEALMLTGDENIIDINFSVFWKVSDAKKFLFDIRNPAETVRAAAESMMREVIGRTPIQPALTEARARIEADVMTGTQAILDQYNAGIEVTQVQLQKVDPPNAVIESFRDVQRANTDAERVRNEAESYRNDIVPRARGEAARIVAEAEGAKSASIAEANGQAQRFLSVYKAYAQAKDVTLKRLYIDTMQDILTKTPSIVVDDQLKGIVPYLPLDTAAPPRPAPAAIPQPAPTEAAK